MLKIKTYIAKSPINGIGLFFAENVKANTLLWSFDERVDLVFTDKEFSEIPDFLRSHFLKYTYQDIDSKLWLYCGDNARFTNHSKEANVISKSGENFGYDFALRDIKAGEEYLANYAQWDLNFKNNFTL